MADADKVGEEPFEVADVTFIVEEKSIHGNRVFLSLHSPYFKRMFFGPPPSSEREIKLAAHKKYADISVMFKLLMLVPGEALINDDNVEKLLELAEEFQLKQVKAECEKFLLFYWKDKEKTVDALKLAEKFGLHLAIKELLKTVSDCPSILADENVEQILTIAQEHQLVNATYHCEKFLLENYKSDAQKVVRALELSAKFNLEKSLANLLYNEDPRQSTICDDNVERLLQVCRTYSLAEQTDVCVRFIFENWAVKGERVLRAVEIAHEMNLPDLAMKFIPLAACRTLAEINASLPKLSTELYAAIVHAYAIRLQALGAGNFTRVFLPRPCKHGRTEAHYREFRSKECPGPDTLHPSLLYEAASCSSCLKPIVNKSLQFVCTCLKPTPQEDNEITNEMIKRSRRD